MEKLTVNKVLKTQEVQGKFGPQVRSAFTTNEYGERIFSTFAKYAVKEGQVLEGTIEQQERDGKTFHNFKFAPKGGLSDGDRALIATANRNAAEALAKYAELRGVVTDMLRNLTLAGVYKEYTSDGKEVPDFGEVEKAEELRGESSEEPPIVSYDDRSLQ